MEAAVSRLSVNGYNVRFERATLVDFLGWRVLVVGAAAGAFASQSDLSIEVTVSGQRYAGTARVSAPQGTEAKPPHPTVLRGIGSLDHVGAWNGRG